MLTKHGSKYYLRHKVTNLERLYLNFSNWLRKELILSCLPIKAKYDLLDVGCGEGDFLKSFPDLLFNKTGVDIHKPQTTPHFKFILGKFEQAKIADSFDIITANHVIEHLEDGSKFLNKAFSLLKPNGVLCISTPNKGSFGYWIAKNKWYHFDYPHHSHLYDTISLVAILKSSGFSSVKIFGEFPGFPFDFFHTLKNLGSLYLLLMPVFILIKLFIPETILAICKK